MHKDEIPNARIIITPGEPAGIGPDIVLRIAQQAWPAELIVVADPQLLTTRAQQLKLPIQLLPVDFKKPSSSHQPGMLKILAVPLNTAVTPGILNRDNASYVLECLKKATDACLKKQARALVTGPIHKGIMNEAGIPFSGHTEFLAQYCHAAQSLMLFVTPLLKVALATTHLPLTKVPTAITREHLVKTIQLLHDELQKRFHFVKPTILVCGLNPHAGEMGHLGHEEIDTIEPALEICRTCHINVIGPLPADTVFTDKYIKIADAILAMYHDQALPVVKFQGFGHAINVTLGLPIVRTSVDHGTALDLAGTQQADAGSLSAAIELAIQLTQ